MPGESELLAAAVARHQAGDLDGAEQAYRSVLARDPKQVKAWKLLGVLARDAGRVGQAIDCLQTALECVGPEPRLYFHLAQSYAAADDWDGAIRSYRQSLTLDEAAPKVQHALALALVRHGFLPEAINHFRRAMQLDPAAIETHFRLAVTLASDGQAGAAEAAYRRLLELCPDHAPAWSNLGALVQDRGQCDEAIQCYQRAIAYDPQCVAAHFNLGTAWGIGGDFAESAAAFEQAIRLRPDFADACGRLGEALAAQGQSAAAQEQFQRAARLRPDRLSWAVRAATIGERIFADNEEIDAYRSQLAARLVEWTDSRWQFDLADLQSAGCPPPAALAYQGRDDRPLKSQYAGLFGGRLPQVELRRRTGKPRVGFVVTPGHEGIFLRGMAGVLNQLDTSAMEFAVTCGAAATNLLAAQIESPHIERLVLPLDFSQAAEVLQAGQFDLLYFWEIGTDRLNYFLPLLKTAPLQCTSWGWPVTSGIPQVDFFISSSQLEPAGAEQHYSERLVRLEHIPNYYYRPDFGGLTADRARFGFSPGEHLYVCPQNPRKFHPDFDPLLGSILRGDPAGVFALLSASPAYLTDQLRARFARRLPDVADRIRILPRMTKGEFWQLLASADVVLDTPHYGGGANTTYDILALGQPLVTLAGEFHRGRYAAAACRRIGLDELVAATTDDYVRIANRLGKQRDGRRALAERIRESAAGLFDHRAAVVELQEFFLQAIEQCRAG